MFKINLQGEKEVLFGVTELTSQLKLELARDGFLVNAVRVKEGQSEVISDKECATVKYDRLSRFYLGLGIVLANFKKTYTEKIVTDIEQMGVMLDCSRNSVVNPPSVKRFIRQIAMLGFDYLHLYTEDTYEIKEEPLFGYMRGRYSHEEIKDMDSYAQKFGIELIPCIQVLAHLHGLFHWDRFRKIRDTQDILLLRDEDTYALIDNMFKNISLCYSSKKINIGLDEAWLLGSGQFLNKNGYVKRVTLMIEHLKRVHEIALKYGMKISMWNDMFFRIVNGNSYSLDGKDFSDEIKSLITDDMNLIYWEYSHEDYEYYDRCLKDSLKLTENTSFAGAVVSWNQGAPDNGHAQKRLPVVMDSCRSNGIKNVLITSWGDDGGECSKFSILPSLLKYAQNRFNVECDINEQCKAIFDYTFDEFMKIDYVNRFVNLAEYPDDRQYYGCCCKFMLFNDPFMGLFDNNISDDAPKFARENRDILKKLASRNNDLSYLFDTFCALSDVLIEKSVLGKKIKAAYDKNDLQALKDIAGTIGGICRKLEKYALIFEKQWHNDNKMFGWEVVDVKLGGLSRRLQYTKRLLNKYTSGEITEIEALTFARVDSDETEKHGRYMPWPQWWKDVVTVQRFD